MNQQTTSSESRPPAEIIPLRLAITAMRDSGYKNTAYALAELIDNSIQANASRVEVFCIERKELISQRERRRLSQIAVLDNGEGMDAQTLRMALQFGNGTRLGDRSGIGRFGMGLPNASISQARRVDVWSWQNGPDNALRTHIDLDEIEAGSMWEVPEPSVDAVPQDWRDLAEGIEKSGTLVVWSPLDIERLTWKSATHTLSNTERIVGRIYRRFIMKSKATIRLVALEEGRDEPLVDRSAVHDDPLYLVPSTSMPTPFDQTPMFEKVFDDPAVIEYKGKEHTVNVCYSVATVRTVEEAGSRARGATKYGQHARTNVGVSVLRADREIMLDQGWCIGYDPRERWWGAEVEFPPALDELFGVTNNKQAATHFSELAVTEWEQLAEEGEEFRDVVNRLKEDGDPRGWLLDLAKNIKQNLEQLREILKSQAVGLLSSKKDRHGTTDETTEAVNKGWKKRSEEHPAEGDSETTSPEILDDIKSDLTENKALTQEEAEELVSLIQDSDLKVVFIDMKFQDDYQLFNVEMKGPVTEVIFNRNHPSFEDIFGTVSTADEHIDELGKEELVERLYQAINATKIIFAAWARYEREAGVDKLKALKKVRFDWGQIAAKFLEPDEDLNL